MCNFLQVYVDDVCVLCYDNNVGAALLTGLFLLMECFPDGTGKILMGKQMHHDILRSHALYIFAG